MQTEQLLTGQDDAQGPNKAFACTYTKNFLRSPSILTVNEECREKERQTEWRNQVCEDLKDQKLVFLLRRLSV